MSNVIKLHPDKVPESADEMAGDLIDGAANFLRRRVAMSNGDKSEVSHEVLVYSLLASAALWEIFCITEVPKDEMRRLVGLIFDDWPDHPEQDDMA